MTDLHLHTWSPIPGETAQYACECDATGYRNTRGVIVEHKTRRTYAKRWTAMDKTRNSGDGRVGFSPLEDYDGPKEKD